jgi:hypothetical protein
MIAGMMSRPARLARHILPLLPAFLLLSVPLTANGGELMPFETPEEEIQWDKIDLDEFNSALPTLSPDTPVPEVQPPVDNRPDWPPPKIDAYLDTSFSNADFASLGYRDTVSGYRFIAGFAMATPALGRWSVAAEFGYNRIGRAERSIVTVDDSAPNYTVTRTEMLDLDLSSLDFGGRVGYRMTSRLEAYTRAGMHFYHTSEKSQTRFDFEEKNLNPPRPSDLQQPASTSTASVGAFGTVGLALKAGSVPSFYAEYTTRDISGDVVDAINFGVLMNF